MFAWVSSQLFFEKETKVLLTSVQEIVFPIEDLDYRKLESALQRQLDKLADDIKTVDWVINSKKIIDTVEDAKTELFKDKK